MSATTSSLARAGAAGAGAAARAAVGTASGADGTGKRQERCEAEAVRAIERYSDTVRPEEAAAAHEAGLSCGKYRAFLELQRLDPDIIPEDVQGMTMREIREENFAPFTWQLRMSTL